MRTFKLIAAFLTVFALTVNAENAAGLATTITNYGLTASVSGNTVTVTGTKTDATSTLNLAINAGVKVIWRASLTGGNTATEEPLMYKSGAGSFEVQSGKIEQINAGNAIYNDEGDILISGGEVSATSGTAVYNDSATVNISGGTVSATTGDVIFNSSGVVNISGGLVTATDGGVAVYNEWDNGKITVSGTARITSATNNAFYPKGTIQLGGRVQQVFGTVVLEITGGEILSTGGLNIQGSSTSGKAICNRSFGAVNISGGTITATDSNGVAVWNESSGTVNISGGIVKATGKYGVAVYGDATGEGTINISGGTVTTATTGVYGVVRNSSKGPVNINGGTILATGIDATAIYNEKTGTITISGGEVKVAEGIDSYAVYNASSGTVNINGGTVSTPDGISVVNNSSGQVNISGGIVSATSSKGIAVWNNSSGPVNISGGTVSATSDYAVYKKGTGIITLTGGLLFAYGTSAGDVIYGDYTTPSGDAVIAAWNQAAGNTNYTALTNDDIVSLPATAVWFNKDGKSGILANNGSNVNFAELDVTVPGNTPIRSPQIATNNIRVQATTNAIILENLPNNAKIEVYNLHGKLIFTSGKSLNRENDHPTDVRQRGSSGRAWGSDNLVIPVQAKGMYIVKMSFGSGMPAKTLRTTVTH